MDGILRASVGESGTARPLWEADPSLVDYNSWIESDTGRKLADSLPKDVILAEGLSAHNDYDTSLQLILA